MDRESLEFLSMQENIRRYKEHERRAAAKRDALKIVRKKYNKARALSSERRYLQRVINHIKRQGD